jgi:hypothetical protein
VGRSEWLLLGPGGRVPSGTYLPLREQCQGFEGNTVALATRALHALPFFTPLLGLLEGAGHPSGPVAVPALLNPPGLPPPITVWKFVTEPESRLRGPPRGDEGASSGRFLLPMMRG